MDNELLIRLNVAEKQFGVVFQNKNLLFQALTHRSYLNENRSWQLGHNERLEFLGDAVLELIVTENLFQKYPGQSEGALTAFRAALVNGWTLSSVGRKLGLEKFLLLSRGEQSLGGARNYILVANAFEALIGALYLDSGYQAVKDFVNRALMPELERALDKRDPKGFLQERAQRELRVTPAYQILEEFGPDHDKKFVAGVFAGTRLLAKGMGCSKKQAEMKAAENALLLFPPA